MSCVSRPAGVHSEFPSLKQPSDLNKRRLGFRTFWEQPAGGKPKNKQSKMHASSIPELINHKGSSFFLLKIVCSSVQTKKKLE